MAVSCDGPMAAYDERDPLTTVTKPVGLTAAMTAPRPHTTAARPHTATITHSRQSRFPAVGLTATLGGPQGHSSPKTVIFYQKREYARLPIGSGTGPNRPSGRKRLYVKVPHGS